MKNIIITGTSSGIGKAIAELYLERGEKVTGIGRRHTIVHVNYTPVNCDLSDKQAVEQLTFELSGACLLINNAGILGNVQRISDQDKTDTDAVFNVNVIAPAVLMNTLSKACGDQFPLTFVNISSGAAQRAIPSWAAYCASKAALEMLSETFYLEEQEKGRMTTVYAVAPGVVDTNMQAGIRSVSSENFSALAGFQAYKDNNELDNPRATALKLEKLLNLPYDGTVRFSLRDIDL